MLTKIRPKQNLFAHRLFCFPRFNDVWISSTRTGLGAANKLFSVSESWARVTLCSYLQCTLTLLWADHWEWRNTLVVPPLDMGTAQQLSIIILQASWFVHGPSLDHRSSEAKLSQASLSQVKATQHLRIQHNKVHHTYTWCAMQLWPRGWKEIVKLRQGSGKDRQGMATKRPLMALKGFKALTL